MIISIILISVLFFVTLYAISLIRLGRYIGLILPPFSLVAAILVVFPDYSNVLANAVGVGRGADLLLYTLFMVVCLFAVLTHVKQRQQTRMITAIVRELALQAPITPSNSGWPRGLDENGV